MDMTHPHCTPRPVPVPPPRPLTLDFAMSTFLDLVQQYPGDGGCFQVFFLNIVTLSPGAHLGCWAHG